MTREIEISHKIAILATGDEISQGDIINSNSQETALRLVNKGMHVRMHMVAPDSIHEIEEAIRFLLDSHQALIITGGLGPTSDDLTRYALGNVLQLPLVFDNPTWEAICERFKHYGYGTPPESNRQQALFPAGSTVIPNAMGSAAGCIARHNNKLIFMLPGPPVECLPMIDNTVLTTLIQSGFQHASFHKKWFLFGVSEGKIAEELDTIAKPYDCITGYRISYPYVEFKLHSKNQHDFNTLTVLIEETIQPYLVGTGQDIASNVLKQKLSNTKHVISICDNATGGALEATITTPKTRPRLIFTDNKIDQATIEINGLQEYWQEKKDTSQTQLEMTINGNKKSFTIPYRQIRCIEYAVEFISWRIYEYLSEMK